VRREFIAFVGGAAVWPVVGAGAAVAGMIMNRIHPNGADTSHRVGNPRFDRAASERRWHSEKRDYSAGPDYLGKQVLRINCDYRAFC
jgi:hypothetical protein